MRPTIQSKEPLPDPLATALGYREAGVCFPPAVVGSELRPRAVRARPWLPLLLCAAYIATGALAFVFPEQAGDIVLTAAPVLVLMAVVAVRTRRRYRTRPLRSSAA